MPPKKSTTSSSGNEKAVKTLKESIKRREAVADFRKGDNKGMNALRKGDK
jgi:hypothetical protein